MTRKDSDKDSERPHYYSQFWLDIAAGRRTIGGPKPDEEGELLEDSQEPIALRRPFRSEPEEDLDEIEEPVAQGERPAALSRPVSDAVSPSFNDVVASEPDEVPLAADDMDSLAVNDSAVNDSVEDADIPDVDFATDEDDVDEEENEDNEEEFFDEEEEDEEDEGWVAGRGRKKVTPKRATKQPPKRPIKREPRRGF